MSRSLHTRHPASSSFSGVPFSSLSEEAKNRAIEVVRNTELEEGWYSSALNSYADAFDYNVEEFIKAHPYYDLAKQEIELYVDLYGPDSKCLFETTMYSEDFKSFLAAKKGEMSSGEETAYEALFLTPPSMATIKKLSGNAYPLEIDHVSIGKSKWKMHIEEFMMADFGLEIEIEYIGNPKSCRNVVVTVSDVAEYLCSSHEEYYKESGWVHLSKLHGKTPYERFLEHLQDVFFKDFEDFAECREDIESEEENAWNTFDPRYFKVTVVGASVPLANMFDGGLGFYAGAQMFSTEDYLSIKYPAKTPSWDSMSQKSQRAVCADYLIELFSALETFCTHVDSFITYLEGDERNEGFIIDQANEDTHDLLIGATKQFEADISDESIIDQIEDRDIMFSSDGSEVLDWG